MPAVDFHPSRADLEAFALGQLPDSTHEAIEEHVNGCSACRLVIEQAPGDTLVALLRSAASMSETPRALHGDATMVDALADTPALAASMTCAFGPVEAESASGVPAALTGHPRYEPTRLLGSGGM